MRAESLVTLSLSVCATIAAAQTPPDGPPPGPRGGRLFISPMGEPFRAAPGEDAPQDQWFARADADHDGTLSQAEMEVDAARFFAVLDRQKDGEIDPDDVDRYETVLAPEIRGAGMGGGPGGPSGGGKGRGGPPTVGGRAPGGGGGPRGGGGDSNGGALRATEGKQGAARFGYLDFPEPVTSTDRNMNRGIDPNEFRLAADARFKLLDTNGDGRIEKSELPRLSQRGMGPMGGRPGARQDVPPPRD